MATLFVFDAMTLETVEAVTGETRRQFEQRVREICGPDDRWAWTDTPLYGFARGDRDVGGLYLRPARRRS